MSAPENLPDHLTPGNRIEIGQYKFEAEDIITFANAWDPQVFHTDEQKAKQSLLGGLCASGWHTLSIWMKLQRKAAANMAKQIENSGLKPPEFGPSPGIRHLKWLKPVYSGDTIAYANEILSLRASNSKPGWHIMQSIIHATNQNGKPVMRFDSTVFIRFHD